LPDAALDALQGFGVQAAVMELFESYLGLAEVRPSAKLRLAPALMVLVLLLLPLVL
jgi:hypothetical protein